MWTALIALAQAILPGIFGQAVTGIVDVKKAELAAETNADRQAAQTVNAALGVQRDTIVAAYSHWWSTLLLSALAAPLIIYNCKIYVWDACLGWGETPEIHGLAAQWGTAIIYSITGYSSVLAGSYAIVSGFGRR